MIALNALTLNAPDASPQAAQLPGSAQSIISSDSTAQDFSALLTELVGPGAIDQTNPSTSASMLASTPANAPALPQTITPDANTPKIPGNSLAEQLKTQDAPAVPAPKKTDTSTKLADASQTDQTVIVPFAGVTVAASVMNDQKPITVNGETEETQKTVEPASIAPAEIQKQIVMPQILTPEMQRAWADVKKFELTVQADNSNTIAAHAQPQVAPVDFQKEATIVTTDPIANIQLQQLPPRITAIEKLLPDAKLADRAKPGAVRDAVDTSTTSPTLHFADVTKGIEQVEQIRPAQPVEIPQTPHVQVVRTIAMEVGDADSQVTVRIQERAGDISLQINASSEPLHQDLQSSVGSLVHALRQEQVQVSNVDVSRKSPIEKVRRMKEAHS